MCGSLVHWYLDYEKDVEVEGLSFDKNKLILSVKLCSLASTSWYCMLTIKKGKLSVPWPLASAFSLAEKGKSKSCCLKVRDNKVLYFVLQTKVVFLHVSFWAHQTSTVLEEKLSLSARIARNAVAPWFHTELWQWCFTFIGPFCHRQHLRSAAEQTRNCRHPTWCPGCSSFLQSFQKICPGVRRKAGEPVHTWM